MKTLTAAKARDLMKKDVLTLEASAPIREAVERFLEYHISGAPVTDATGQVVGVLSATDIALAETDEHSEPRQYAFFRRPDEAEWDDETSFGEDYSPEAFGEATVGDYMSRKVVSVRPDASIKEVCAVMARESIHRVLVVDETDGLAGIISSFDVVKHVAANG